MCASVEFVGHTPSCSITNFIPSHERTSNELVRVLRCYGLFFGVEVKNSVQPLNDAVDPGATAEES